MRKFNYLLGVILGLFCFSCSDFLKDYPKDQVYPASISDFDELLIGDAYQSTSERDIGIWINLMADNAAYKTSGSMWTECNFYSWEPEPDTKSTYTKLYKRISVCNAVLDEIDNFKDEGEDYRKVKGQALFLRAANYYWLVNLYGKPYTKEHSETDPGVALKLTSVIEDKKFSRNSVAEVYNVIVSDLNNAIALLKGLDLGTSYRAGETATRMLLARVYLYMHEWQKVVDQCDTILMDKNYTLIDYNDYPSTFNCISGKSPEMFFTSGTHSYAGTIFLPFVSYYFYGDPDFLATFASGDRRLKAYFSNYGRNGCISKRTNDNEGKASDFFTLRLPEAYLSRAEALAILGKDAEAIADVQKLREKRFTTGTLDEVNLSGEELVNFIREERRKEFCFEGQRWFDLRRMAVSPKYPYQKEIVHPYYIKGDVVGDRILRKYDEEPEFYVLPLPYDILQTHGGVMVQNDERTQKEPNDLED